MNIFVSCFRFRSKFSLETDLESVRSENLWDMRKEEISEEVGGFPRQLGRHVVDGADQYSRTLKNTMTMNTLDRFHYFSIALL